MSETATATLLRRAAVPCAGSIIAGLIALGLLGAVGAAVATNPSSERIVGTVPAWDRKADRLVVGRPLTRIEVEAMQDDLDRARAAYPSVALRDLADPRWFPVEPNAGLSREDHPEARMDCGTNRSCRIASAQLLVVKAAYPLRASEIQTAGWRARSALGRQTTPRNRRLVMWTSQGRDGYTSADCDEESGCTVRHVPPGTRLGDQWQFAFIPTEWDNAEIKGFAGIRSMPSFATGTRTPFELPKESGRPDTLSRADLEIQVPGAAR